MSSDINIASLSDRQFELLPKLITAGAKVGYALLRKGITSFPEWSESMRDLIGKQLKNAELTDSEVEGWIREMWDCHYAVDGATRKMSDWANILNEQSFIKNINNHNIVEQDLIQQDVVEGSIDNISMDTIVATFKNYSEKKRLKDIISSVMAVTFPDNIMACPEIEDRIRLLVKEDQKRNEESWLTYSKGYYSKRKKKQGLGDSPMQITEYTGRAGECAVMSELMFNHYNVNRMMIDEGVDIVAVKDNIYYYIQVKTVAVKDGRINAQVSIDNFDKYIGAQMRYIIVARTKDGQGTPKNVFFTFSQQEITKGIFDRCIKRGDKVVSIKIKFHERSGEPLLYDEKEVSAKWNMNRFDLI